MVVVNLNLKDKSQTNFSKNKKAVSKYETAFLFFNGILN
jgi:hypothetical protein